MPIDPNIALSVKPVQIANPLEQYMQVQQIQQAQNQSRLADLMYGEKQQQVARAQGLRALANGWNADTTDEQRTASLRNNAYFDEADKLDTSLQNRVKVKADAAKAQAEAHAKQVETAGKQLDMAGQAFGYVRSNPTRENAHAALDYLAANGAYTPEQVAQLKGMVDANPSNIQSMADQAFRAALSAKDQLPKIDTRNLGGTTETFSVDPVTGKVVVMNSTKNTQSPDNAAIVAATRRGQDLTDARARELGQQGQYDADRGVLIDKRTGVARQVMGPDGKPLQGGKPLTEFQGKSAAFADRAQEADAILNQLHAKGPTGLGLVASDRPGTIKGIAESVPFIGEGLGGVVNALPSAIGGPNSNQQRAEQAQRNFVNAILRQESGAAIGAGEFENARKQYFPQPGDTPEVIAQKAANRRTAIAGLARSAGSSYTPPAAPEAAASANNGLPSGWSVEVH
jgi:hypothetical protein